MLGRGLRVEELDSAGVLRALRYRRKQLSLSLPDSFALALAAGNGWTLLTGDRVLRALASEESVDCHGVLWLLDRMFEVSATSARKLCAGLEAICAHPRCRLPKSETSRRLMRYSRTRTDLT